MAPMDSFGGGPRWTNRARALMCWLSECSLRLRGLPRPGSKRGSGRRSHWGEIGWIRGRVREARRLSSAINGSVFWNLCPPIRNPQPESQGVNSRISITQ